MLLVSNSGMREVYQGASFPKYSDVREVVFRAVATGIVASRGRILFGFMVAFSVYVHGFWLGVRWVWLYTMTESVLHISILTGSGLEEETDWPTLIVSWICSIVENPTRSLSLSYCGEAAINAVGNYSA